MKTINLGILAHVDAGKTTLTEQLLFQSGAIRKAGRVDDGTAQTDWLEVERRRGISVRAASSRIEWGGAAMNLIDTPGHADFSGEVERSLGALDCAILLLSAVEGVQSQTKLLWQALRSLSLPCFLVINKLDREGSDWRQALVQAEKELPGSRFLPLETVSGETTGSAAVEPQPFNAPDFREELLLTLSDFREDLAEEFWVEWEVPQRELEDAFAQAVAAGQITPVLLASAKEGIGCQELMDAIVRWMPGAAGDPLGPLSGLVYKVEHDKAFGKAAHVRLFSGTLKSRDPVPVQGREEQEKITQIRRRFGGKTIGIGEFSARDIALVYGLSQIKTGDVLGELPLDRNYSLAVPLLQVRVFPETEEELPALVVAFQELADEDPLLDLLWLPDQRELHLKLTGAIQLEVLEELCRQRFGLNAKFGSPTVIYKETPAAKAVGFESYTWPKPCWAEVELEIEPLPRGSGVVYSSAIKEKQIFYRYQHHIETSVKQNLKQGVYGWEVTDLKITLIGGSHHTIHTHPLDFFVATPVALLDGLTKCGSILLEPFVEVEMSASEDVLGRILGDIVEMRGEFDTPEMSEGSFVLKARLPAATSLDYPAQFRSLTSGKGIYSSRFLEYRECPLELGQTCPRRGINPLDRAKWILWARHALL